jgi:hypothetical protein
MITDQDVVKRFTEFARLEFSLTEVEKIAKSTQIYERGVGSIILECARHEAVFKHMQIIPKYCFGCFKVLISSRNVI